MKYICPICRKPVEDVPTAPFCSKRCKLLDLGAWMDENYRVRGEEGDAADESAGAYEPAEKNDE